MKKFIILLVMVMSVAMVNAQKSKVQAAKNYNSANPPKLEKALIAIEKAVAHKKTGLDAKTWFIRGNIFLKIALTNNPEYQNLSANPLAEVEKSYTKCKEFDGKNIFLPQIMQNASIINGEYYNSGVQNFQTEKYDEAIKYFEGALRINKELLDVIDTTAIYNISLCAGRSGDIERAKAEYHTLLELGYYKPNIYTALAQLYYNAADTVKAFEVIAEGRVKFEKNFDVLITETNYLLAANETERALANLEKALEYDDQNAQIFFAVGAQYDNLGGNTEEIELQTTYRKRAIENYENAIALDTNYFDPVYNLGAINVNIASDIINRANNEDDDDKYALLKAEANTYLEAAAPYLEKAHILQSEDLSTLYSLREIYVRLNKLDKVKEVNAKIDAKTAE